MTDLNKEHRAWALLRWHDDVIDPDAPFDPHLAAAGFYSRAQKKRSDAALDQWDEEHPWIESPQLAAFHRLEAVGVFTDADYFSPSKARDQFYTKRLKQWEADNQRTLSTGSTSGVPGEGVKPRRRHRCR